MTPSPYLGTQTSTAYGPPPVQDHVERIDKQSEAHPYPSVLFPSSHTSGEFQAVFPQISH